MMSDTEFQRCISRIRAGDNDAARELLAEFEPEIRVLIRVRLPRVLRVQFDSMDFVQAVWQSLFSDWDRPPGCLESPAQFRAYLAGIARNKLLAQYRRSTRTKKYNLKREEPLVVRRGVSEEPNEPTAHDPSPSQAAQAEDCWRRMLAGRSSRVARVVELRRDGLTFEEVGRELGMSDRSVRRVIESIRQRMEPRPWA
jgi:RNA polymerase sigma-70 factor (ECF subfamily)